MKISERAIGYAAPLSEKDWPLSEQFRIIAKEYADLDGAARMLESMRDSVLSEMVGRRDGPVTRAERDAKACPEYQDYLKRMVGSRTAANLKKYQLEYIRMKHMEETSIQATARAERRL